MTRLFAGLLLLAATLSGCEAAPRDSATGLYLGGATGASFRSTR